jgi:hypothetical protein
MKIVDNIMRAACLALLALALGTSSTSAAGPTGSSPFEAYYFDSQPHMIPGNAGLWFRFDYDASNLAPITIQLIDGADRDFRLDVWTPDVIGDIANNSPMGHGSAPAVACPPESGKLGGCHTRNLIWSGSFWQSGTYYVQVWNDNAAPAEAKLAIASDAVTLGFQPPPNTIIGGILSNNDSPDAAADIDNQTHLLVAGGAAWYRFDYDATDRPRRTLLLVNGNHSGVKFDVWTPDRLNNWWENTPTGRGTVHFVDCDTGAESAFGQCEAPYLKWGAAFPFNWTVYVRVVNTNGYPTAFTLTMQ